MRHWTGFLLCLSFLTACGRGAEVQSADPELVPYLNEFERIALESGIELPSISVTLKLATEENDFKRERTMAAGYCEVTPVGRTVSIHRRFWDANPDPSTRELLVFHELGHCLLNRSHDETLVSDPEAQIVQAPRSIMFPEVFSGRIYQRRHQAYLRELFGIDAAVFRTAGKSYRID